MPKLYLVGGAVRDSILNIPTKDYDYACEAKSYEEMREYVISKGWDIKLEKPEYLTIRAVSDLGGVDIVLCRKDGAYYDGRRPESVTPGTIYDDLCRRDATCNAIAKDVDTGEIYDPFDGVEDCKNKVLKCVGRAYDRLSEDKLRLLRMLRLSITKDLQMDAEILYCLRLPELIDGLDSVSVERIADELTKMFKFSTLKTLAILDHFFLLRHKVFSGKIWLLPTLKER